MDRFALSFALMIGPLHPRTLCCAVVLFCCATTSPLLADKKQTPRPAGGLTGELERILTRHDQPKARLGAKVIDLSSGRSLLDLNADTPMVPASNMKLIVMCAALDAFGKDYQFMTTLALHGDDLVVLGGGDPTLGDDRLSKKIGKPTTAVFRDWAAKLKAAGVTRLRGDLIIDDSLFDRQFVHPSWPPPQYQAWYEAPVGALNFSGNCVDIRVRPTKPGQSPSVSVTPPSTLLSIVNKSQTGPKQTVSISRPREKDELVLIGTVAKDVSLGPVTVRDPGLHFAYAFKTVLAANGISLDGKIVRRSLRTEDGKLPPGCRVIAEHRSPITWALARSGKQSLGMMAEALIKLLGTKHSAVGSWDSGRAAVKEFLNRAGVRGELAVIDDGSGLSRNNRLAPSAVTAVLQYMYQAKGDQFETLLEVLSHAGIDGTLEKRMRFPETKGRVFAKTGYIDGVRTLAGYIQTRSGRWLAFAFFYNGAAKTRPLTELQDQACRLLAEWPGE